MSYTSATRVFEDMVNADGVKSLYRGLLSPSFGFGAIFAVCFRFGRLIVSSLIIYFFSTYGSSGRAIAQYKNKAVSSVEYSEMV
jgi:hypothetical protein